MKRCAETFFFLLLLSSFWHIHTAVNAFNGDGVPLCYSLDMLRKNTSISVNIKIRESSFHSFTISYQNLGQFTAILYLSSKRLHLLLLLTVIRYKCDISYLNHSHSHTLTHSLATETTAYRIQTYTHRSIYTNGKKIATRECTYIDMHCAPLSIEQELGQYRNRTHIPLLFVFGNIFDFTFFIFEQNNAIQSEVVDTLGNNNNASRPTQKLEIDFVHI